MHVSDNRACWKMHCRQLLLKAPKAIAVCHITYKGYAQHQPPSKRGFDSVLYMGLRVCEPEPPSFASSPCLSLN